MRASLAATILVLGALLLPLSSQANPSKGPCVPKPKPKPKPCPTKKTPPPYIPPYVPPQMSCPVPSIKISGCINLLGGLVNIVIGQGVLDQCCPLFTGLSPLLASHCVCSCIKSEYPDPAPFLPKVTDLLAGCGLPPLPYLCA